ncbi:MAG TPA: fluoride efflux transporter CrcB [Steroidobacteraceae bacterium]|nr:fluoride efflux transporter CrcB [Steroidobacteraceae bacterium]
MPWLSFFAVGSGAALGAWMRWGLGLWLNPVFPTVPLGTVTANLFGGFLMGIVMSAADPLGLAPATRLLLATGFLGGLTTFSTFSAETTTLLLRHQYAWACLAVAVHVGGSLLLTAMGLFLARGLLGR